jgi:hypothetical protein
VHSVPRTSEEADALASAWPVATVAIAVNVDLDLDLDLNPTRDLNPTLDLALEVDPIIERFATLHHLDTATIDVRPGDVSRTFTVAPGMACATYARGADALATLALALHEAGHALFRAQMPPTSRTTSALADPPRWLDEAVAAWAVRALEDPRVIGDAAIRAESRRRRRRREAITSRLAAFEAGAIPWPSDLSPSDYPALTSEPGVMAAYAAADLWPRRLVARKVRP